MMKRGLVLFVVLLLAGCSSATPPPAPTELPTNTSMPSPTAVPSSTPTPKPSPTWTKIPTSTPTSTDTPTPLSPKDIAKTVTAEAQAVKEWEHYVQTNCKAIEWVELSEVEYAKSHEDECVFIRGRVSDLNFDEDIISIWIGQYSANIPIGIGNLAERNGRIVDDDWIQVYGNVCSSGCWVSRNRLDNSETDIAGVEAMLILTSRGDVWRDTSMPMPPVAGIKPGQVIQKPDGRLFELQADGTWVEVPMELGLEADGTCHKDYHPVYRTSTGKTVCIRNGY
jgi:hypothetical protein